MLKEFIYNWKTNSALKNSAKIENVSFDKATSIGFLFEDDSNYKITKTFIETLTKEGKSVSILIKSDEKEIISEKHFTSKQCKWFGKIENENVVKFINTPFDYLFLLNENPHYLSEYI